LPDLQNLKKYF